MALKLYRLHRKDCARKADRYDRSIRNCNCPTYVDGLIGGDFLKTKSLGLSSAIWHSRFASFEEVFKAAFL